MYENLLYSLFFISEAIGQIFLATDNRKSYLNNHPRVVYFSANSLGFFAALSFSITVIVRAMITAQFLDSNSTLLLILVSLILLCYLLYYCLAKTRLDLISGVLIASSAFILAFVLFSYGISDLHFYFALNQLTYALLLVASVFLFKPWVAELINIFVWIALFLILSSLIYGAQ